MIYIATHKKFNVPNLENYIPIQVGAYNKKKLGYLCDDTENNISYKNPNFCELTGLYWVWKNVKDEYKGLVHYRRYFGKTVIGKNVKKIYTYNSLIKMLDNVDIILPYVESFKQNAKEELLRECCTKEIFDILERIIKSNYPEFSNAFDKYFCQNKSVLFNMMFCRAKIFDEYCEWLFGILFELEKNIDISNLNDYQKRLFGFLSERLLNIWILQKGYTYKNINIINTEMPIIEQIRLLRRRISNELYYRIIGN